jgi:hypothetical protein
MSLPLKQLGSLTSELFSFGENVYCNLASASAGSRDKEIQDLLLWDGSTVPFSLGMSRYVAPAADESIYQTHGHAVESVPHNLPY